MSSNNIKRSLEDLPNVGCEAPDIAHSMVDEAEFARTWIHDCILRQHTKQSGDDRLSAETRKMIKAKSYYTYISLSQNIHHDMQEKANSLLSTRARPLSANNK